jgi:hypothetical protein
MASYCWSGVAQFSVSEVVQFWMTVHSWHSRAVTNPLGLQRRVVRSCK